jgi:uncharacterized membrane protein YeaQ/YmgE (transglycosylase-associated protein family)
MARATSRFDHGRVSGRRIGHSSISGSPSAAPGALLEETVTVTGIITAIIVGAIIGALGRLVVPGRQPIPIWLTIVIGIVSAFIGTFIARALGIPTQTSGIDWLELIVQVVVAAIGVAIVAGVYSRRGIHR